MELMFRDLRSLLPILEGYEYVEGSLGKVQEWRTCNWYGDARWYHGLTNKSYQLSHIIQGMMVPQRPTMIMSLMTQNGV